MEDGENRTRSEHRPSPISLVSERAFLFVALECARPLAGSARFALDDADETVVGRGNARACSRTIEGSTRRLAITLPDERVSQSHVRIIATGSGHVLEDRGSRNGTKVNGADVSRATLHDGDVVQIGRTLLLYRTALLAPEGYASDLDSEAVSAEAELRTLDPSYQARLATLARVARSNAAVLLSGETGAGKELLARAVHRIGRPDGPFVAVNCGAIPTGLVESQLFGHVRGAFSGAQRDEPGFVRAADGGTLFLDEIADLPRASQAALLRVLQEREVVPVGGTRPIGVDVRVVSATHASLEALVLRGEFREDLLARLQAFVFEVPPLRDRRHDIGIIVVELLRRLAPSRAASITFEVDAGLAILAYAWPRNVRELEQCLSVALAVAPSDHIELAHLPASILARDVVAADGVVAAEDADASALRTELVTELERHRGNVAAVARAIGRARPLVHRWIKRFNLDPDVFRHKPD